MKKAELIAMLAALPDDADIWMPDQSYESVNSPAIDPPYFDKAYGRWILAGDGCPTHELYATPVPVAAYPAHDVHIQLNDGTGLFHCTQVGCGSTEFVQFAPAAFRCKACGCGYAAS